jgi:glycosyltransferase involved in cell wall biosynthesis
MQNQIKLSVIIPAYNEGKRIIKTLESVNDYLKKQTYGYEIIVVANNCTDNTDGIVKSQQGKIANIKLLDLGPGIPGKGGAVKEGFLKAQGEYIMFMDADNATEISELDHFWPQIKAGFDVVIGSRDTKGSKLAKRQTWYRELAGKMGNILIQIVAVPGIKDTQCGFKLFSKKAVEKIFPVQKLGGWGFDIELLALARKHGFKIKEEPVTWHDVSGSKVSLKAYLSVFKDLFKVRWWLWTKGYKDSK